MALEQETIEKIKGIGLDYDGLVAAIQSEEVVKFEVPEIKKGLTDEELATRDATIATSKLSEGEKIGEGKVRTALAKELTKQLGLEIKGEPRIADLVTLVQGEMAKGGDEKVKTLQTAYETLNSELTEARQKTEQAERKVLELSVDRKFISAFPKNINSSLTQDEMLLVVKSNITSEDIDGNTVFKRNGEIIKDPNTLKPYGLDKVVGDLFTEKGWVGKKVVGADGADSSGGRGGGNNTGTQGSGTGIKTKSEALKVWLTKNQGGNVVSPECIAFVAEQAKANKDFNFYM